MQRWNLFDKLFSSGGRDGIVLVFSLLLAFFMWGIQKLSQNYSTYVKYKVSLNAPLEGRVQKAVSGDLLVIRGEASGFYIFQHYYSKEGDGEILEINVDAKQLHKVDLTSDKFYIRSGEIRTKIQEALGEVFRMESLTSDTLYFDFPKQSYKKVPIFAKSQLKYKAQYMPFSSILLKPDSVLIYGQTALLSTIDSVFTNTITGDGLGAPISGLTYITPITGVKYSVKDVYYSQEIGRYIENSVTVKVGIINVPPDKNVALIPPQVELKYRSPFYSNRGYGASDFSVVVDYRDMEREENIVKPLLQRVPKDTYSVRVEPKFIEYFVN